MTTTSDFESKYNGWHKYTSYIKSSIRICTCIVAFATGSVAVLAVGLGVAELVGIVEEWV